MRFQGPPSRCPPPVPPSPSRAGSSVPSSRQLAAATSLPPTAPALPRRPAPGASPAVRPAWTAKTTTPTAALARRCVRELRSAPLPAAARTAKAVGPSATAPAWTSPATRLTAALAARSARLGVEVSRARQRPQRHLVLVPNPLTSTRARAEPRQPGMAQRLSRREPHGGPTLGAFRQRSPKTTVSNALTRSGVSATSVRFGRLPWVRYAEGISPFGSDPRRSGPSPSASFSRGRSRCPASSPPPCTTSPPISQWWPQRTGTTRPRLSTSPTRSFTPAGASRPREKSPPASSPTSKTRPPNERHRADADSRLSLSAPDAHKTSMIRRKNSAPQRIRTSDLRLRRPTLYPAELVALKAPIYPSRARRATRFRRPPPRDSE